MQQLSSGCAPTVASARRQETVSFIGISADEKNPSQSYVGSAMLTNLVTYHVHQCDPLPPYDALAYQYLLAGNGVFIRTETTFFNACICVQPCVVRGLNKIEPQFHLKAAKIPANLLYTILTDARQARRPDGGLNEAFYQFHHQGQVVQVKKPHQAATSAAVSAPGSTSADIICDLHTHGNMPAFWSATDNKDEQGCQVYAVVGKLDSEPEIRMRLGVYGTWLPLPVTAVFTACGPFRDLYKKQGESR